MTSPTPDAVPMQYGFPEPSDVPSIGHAWGKLPDWMCRLHWSGDVDGVAFDRPPPAKTRGEEVAAVAVYVSRLGGKPLIRLMAPGSLTNVAITPESCFTAEDHHLLEKVIAALIDRERETAAKEERDACMAVVHDLRGLGLASEPEVPTPMEMVRDKAIRDAVLAIRARR